MTPTNPEAVERLIERLPLAIKAQCAIIEGPQYGSVETENACIAREVMALALDALASANARIAEEREACAKICLHVREIVGASTGNSIATALAEAADRIRARTLANGSAA